MKNPTNLYFYLTRHPTLPGNMSICFSLLFVIVFVCFGETGFHCINLDCSEGPCVDQTGLNFTDSLASRVRGLKAWAKAASSFLILQIVLLKLPELESGLGSFTVSPTVQPVTLCHSLEEHPILFLCSDTSEVFVHSDLANGFPFSL